MSTTSDNPPYLPIGTEVSSKFRGAFCESTILRIEKLIRIKFTLKEKPFGIKTIDDPNIPLSDMVVGKTVTITVDKKQVLAQVNHVKDLSKYFVVFNDGDQTQLRRSQLVQKGERHFSAEGNLDSMPLTKPEDFSAPVKRDRGSKPKANEPSTSRRVDDGRGAEERDEPAPTAPTPRKRRAAENAMSAIGDMRGVINDTQSEESTDDQAGPAPPSTSKAKSRKRRGEEQMDIDEPTVNGAGPSTSAAANDQDRQLSAKEKKKKKKEKEKKEKQQEEGGDDPKELKRRERKKVERLYRRYIKKSLKRNRDLLRQVLCRRSTRYSLTYRSKRIKPTKQRLVVLPPPSSSNPSKRGSSGERSKWKFPPREFSFVSRYRIRNALLYLKWRNTCRRVKTKARCKYYRQWWKLPNEKSRAIFRNQKFAKNSERKSRFLRLFVGVEQENRLQFVVLHDDVKKSRKLLRLVNEATESNLSFDERCDLTYDDVACPEIRKHFKKETWAPAILLPKSFSVENTQRPERVVRNTDTGKLQRVWADDLVPMKWLPSFEKREIANIVASRKAKNRVNFNIVWRFTRDYCRNRFHRQSLKAMLRCRRRTPTREFAPLKERLKAKIAKLPPPPPEPEIKEEVREEEPVRGAQPVASGEVKEEDESGSEYDSDYSIKNTPVDQRDTFVAVLLQFHDARGSILNTSPNIQGHDVDLYYLCRLAVKVGAPRKIYSSNPWTVWGKKLVPQAVNPEEELKEVFKSCLDEYLTFNLKLNLPVGGIPQRSERKQVQPGIYSENRKKRQKALEQAEAAAAGEPSTSQATPKNRSQYRKRKADTPESGSDRRRGSRNTTMSPGPSEDRDAPGTSTAQYSDTEDDNQSVRDDGRVKRKKSKSAGSQNRRSMSIKEEYPAVQPAKKGRPKKNVATVKNPLVLAKFVGDKTIDKVDEREYVRANLLSVIHAQDSLRAWHDGTWYKAHCVERCDDVTEDIKKFLMKIERGQERLRRKNPLRIELDAIFDRLKIKTHYIGWNGRFDELLSYDYLKVLKDTQVEARRRFAILPNGKKLRPSILAVVERAMCQEDENTSRRPDYLKLAEEVLGNESDFDTDDEPVEEKDRKKKKKERRRFARAIRTDLMEPSSESESEPNNVRQTKRVKKRGAPEVDRGSDPPSSSRRRIASDDHSPEIGERSSTPSSKSSTSIVSSPGKRAAVRDISSSPESQQSGLSPEPSKNFDESEEDSRRESIESTEASGSRMSEEQEFRQRVVPDDHSPELGVQSTSSSEKSSSSSPQRRKTASPKIEAEEEPIALSPDDASRPPSKVPSKESSEEPENVGESTEAAETASSKSTMKGAESDSEEPEYPVVLRTPEPADLPSPCTSSQNYPSLNRQGSSTAMPVFSPATTTLAHSGPLTLEEVPVVATTSSSSVYDRKEDDGSDTEILGKRRRTSAGIESTPIKRMRRASERSAGGTDDGVTSPRRQPAPLAPQPVSGALTLQMAIPESSGPIEPATTASTSKRRKTVAASPTFSTGPLVLDTSPSVASTSTKPPRPPGAPPLGRPKKNSAGSATSSRRTEERDEPRRSAEKVVSPPSAVTNERRSAERRSEDKEDVMLLNNQGEAPMGSPRGGGFGGRGGKRKRGGRAGAVAAARVTPGRTSTSRKSTLDESEEKDAEAPSVAVPIAPPTPIAPPNLSRPDSFANQKARMAKYMEDIGTSQDFHLIGIDFEKVLRESPPEDININLEEMSNEARDLFYQAKAELALLEKNFRKVEAAKKKAAEAAAAEAVEADNPAPSSSEDPSTSSTPNNQ